MQSKPTLCWKCENACGKCSWSDGTFTPVEGWKAKPTTVSVMNGVYGVRKVKSFIVEECPQFGDDTGQYNKRVKRNKWNSTPYLQEVTV